MKEFDECILCPHKCRVNRNKGERGFCQAGNELVIAKAYLHKWEEPCISGDTGSGTIFFSYCNMKCLFCQNYEISSLNVGKDVTIERFIEICLELQDKGALNINLVTPSHFVPLIAKGLREAKDKGLVIPIVYNTSSYENVETLKMLDGLVDIYLPDLKYYIDKYAIKYSKVPHYFEYASKAIDEMYRQVGKPLIEDGMMKKGVIVRHLMLPGMIDDSKKIVSYLYRKYGDNIYMSLMNQYTPIKKLCYEELNHKVSDMEYDELVNYAYDLGVRKAFIQEGETQSESFIPHFDMEGL